MWMFTPEGLFSCTEHPKDTDYIQVRARRKLHLLNLIKRVDDECDYDKSLLITNPIKDYEYRFLVKKDVFSTWMERIGDTIDYPNFKSEATRVHGWDDEYVKMLGRIWHEGMETLGENQEYYFTQ